MICVRLIPLFATEIIFIDEKVDVVEYKDILTDDFFCLFLLFLDRATGHGMKIYMCTSS